MDARRHLALWSAAMICAALGVGCELILGLNKLSYYDDSTGGGGTGGTGGTTTTIDPGCVPDEAGKPVTDDCGVFVSSSKGDDDDPNAGSQGKPFATITKALASPKTGPIYLCAETFMESVHLTAGRPIYGGLDCSDGWAWIGEAKKSEVTPDAGNVALVVDAGIGVVLRDVALHAKDAVDPGGSSIAVIAMQDASVELTRCDVKAGIAQDGADGEPYAGDATAGTMGQNGGDACTAAAVVTPEGPANECGENDSFAGAGGIGQLNTGAPGGAGSPGAAANGGLGADANNPTCTSGSIGDDGAPGTSASGAEGPGTISSSGYTGLAGNNGEPGKPGQGGGGGGGAKGGSGDGLSGNKKECGAVSMAPGFGGASGGTGGSGGCGGLGGKGGQAGGASIGIVSLGATLLLQDVTITAAAGGNGGDGGLGQNGGIGGPGGTGGKIPPAATDLKPGCSGGPGGSGGLGGRGGGGLGGPSIGIAHTGAAPDVKGTTITIGTAGKGGAGEGPTGDGEAGVAAQLQTY